MSSAHFFDLDVLISVKSDVWIVSKTKPKNPVIKLTPSEFNLIKKGVYRKYNSPLSISGTNYWLPENLFNQLKIKCKNLKIDITDLAFSMQEFMNPEIIENLENEVLVQNFQHLKNSNDDIYVICSKNSEKSYEPIIRKLENKLFDLGLSIKKYYYLSETFYNRDTDYIAHKKVRLVLQHLVGQKTDDNKFVDSEIEKYSSVYYYDDELKAIELAKDCNNMFDFLLSNTDEDLTKKIKDSVNNFDHVVYVKQVTHNIVQPLKEFKVVISLSKIAKTFESFLNRRNF